jgi:hypothetical protein
MNCDDAAAGFSYGPGAEGSTPTTRPKCTSAALIYTLFIVIFVAAIRLRLIAMVEKGQRRNCKDQKIARCDRAPIEGMTLRGFVLNLFKTDCYVRCSKSGRLARLVRPGGAARLVWTLSNGFAKI